jgi:hypothetical protein
MTPDLLAFSVSAAAVTSIGRNIATAPTKATRGKRVRFIVYDSEPVRAISPAGRDAWALGNLIIAGAAGCTPIEHVGPRWSHYVWKLRTTYNVIIETIDEPHGGEFSGSHARYVLRSHVRFADPADASRHEGAQ